MALTIRRATLNDRDQVAGLWQELYEYHLALDPRERLAPDAREQYRGRLVDLLTDDTWCFFVAEEDGALVGFISGAVREAPPIMVERVHGYIEDTVVTARSRRRGVGEQLYRAIQEWFRQRKVQGMVLSVAAANPVSAGFWHKMGFQDFRIRMRGELK